MKGTSSYGPCAGQDSSGESHLLEREVLWSRIVTFDDSAIEGGTVHFLIVHKLGRRCNPMHYEKYAVCKESQ